MSRSIDPMKLKINKACDLNSISILPPHSRRSNVMSQASQIRSHSQQSFSQGMSMSQSQLSQSSFDENLMNDQRFGSQERDKSSKRVSSLASSVPTRDESQLQLARTSKNVLRRWSSASVTDSGCQVSEELEKRFRQMESSLNRLGMILDSVQNDVIQINRAVKEVLLETEGVRQKIILLDNSMGHVIKEEAFKAFLDASLKSISQQLMESDGNRLTEITSAISVLPKQIESHLVKFQREVSTIVAEKINVIANGMKSFNDCYLKPIQSPKSKWCAAICQPQKNLIPSPMLPPSAHARWVPVSKMEEEIPKALTGSVHNLKLKQEDIPLAPKEKDFRVIIDSDEESDCGVSCLLVKKETGAIRGIMAGKSNYLIEEANEETLRILRKARKRKRKQSNRVILD